jgi:hypothetical protein
MHRLQQGFAAALSSVILVTLLMSGCSGLRLGWSASSWRGHSSASYVEFNGVEEKQVRLEDGETMELAYEVEVDDGALTIAVQDPDRRTVWEATLEEDARDQVEITAETAGRYNVVIWGAETKGSFDVTWEPN